MSFAGVPENSTAAASPWQRLLREREFARIMQSISGTIFGIANEMLHEQSLFCRLFQQCNKILPDEARIPPIFWQGSGKMT